MKAYTILVDLPIGKKAIGTKWVFRNKKDERGIVIRNKARIEAIRLFLAYASFMGFLVYQMDVKSAFLYETIEEEVYITQLPGFKDLDHPDKVYNVVKALYGLHQAPKAWYKTLANYLLGNKFKRGKIDQTLFIKKQKRRYFACIDVKSASTLVDLEKPLAKDGDADDVDVHLYRSMIGSLMYLIASRYLKGKPTLGLWYSKDSPFELVAYTDNDYAGATQDRNSTTGGIDAGKGWDEARFCPLGVGLDKMERAATTASSLEVEQDIVWKTASLNNNTEDGGLGIELQPLDRIQLKTITEAYLRRHLKLEDIDGISSLPNTEIFEQLALTRIGVRKDKRVKEKLLYEKEDEYVHEDRKEKQLEQKDLGMKKILDCKNRLHEEEKTKDC
ncbi:putative ribonuclease H-like domain-containing protein [Tanacetum coccineum]|uniref:Ribonuclease H-like domain-containing protein n=1 Tax=Tanacetum coccineum TaxID=301880 RepID=A0ABQ4ZVM2_9ASTR